jgi:hypothetical protein
MFESSEDAARKMGLIARNIRHCCTGKRKYCGGIQWFYFEGDEWIYLIKK